MSCITTGKCFQVLPSNCVEYVGEDIPLLGITCGSTVTDVEQAIITKLLTALDGTGITLEDLTFDCDFITNQLGSQDKTLYIVLQLLLNSTCTLKSLIDDLTTEVNTPIAYDPKCLTPGAYTTAGLLQACINEVCIQQAQVDALYAQISNDDLVGTIRAQARNVVNQTVTAPNGLIRYTGSGENFNMYLLGMVPPFTPLFTYADLGVFEASGKGKAGTAFAEWYICNGLNSTPDLRGYTVAGATSLPGINGQPLQSAVDPTQDVTYATSIYDRRGEVKHTLSIPEIPSHNHTATDNGHTHPTNISGAFQPAGNASGPSMPINAAGNTSGTGYANISVSSTGGSQKHENRQPTFYGYFITRIGY